MYADSSEWVGVEIDVKLWLPYGFNAGIALFVAAIAIIVAGLVMFSRKSDLTKTPGPAREGSFLIIHHKKD